MTASPSGGADGATAGSIINVAVPAVQQQVRLVRYPAGVPQEECFELTEGPVPAAGDGRLLVEVCDLSLDPYVRTAITGKHLGDAATPLASVMPGRSIARVLRTTSGGPPVGSHVLAETGWQQFAAVQASTARPVTPVDGVPRSAALGALGMPGLTGYVAITRQLRPRVGDTVAVSSATGAVGSVAGQLARLSGARTIAIVGGAAKATVAREVFGYHAAVDRTDPHWRAALVQAAPDGVDCYLHSGDADVLAGVLRSLAIGARVTLCGLMDQYNDGGPSMMPAGAVIAARAVVQGIVVYDHLDLADEHRRRVGALLASGAMTILEDRVSGLAAAPEAFVRLMSGTNVGKAIVEVAR